VEAYGLTEYDGKEEGGIAMTEKELRQKPVDYLAQYVGIKEGSVEHKAILAVLNNSGLCKRYKMTVNDAWCATAVSAAYIASRLADIFPCVECSCGNMIELARKAGIWVENDAYVPKTGDAILYDWGDSGNGDCTGWPDHVGLVASVSGSAIRVIEGNMSNTVGYRNLAVNGRYIRGFITPKFSTKATSSGSGSAGTSGKKSVSEIAKEVIAGKWGNGDARKSAIKAAGYDYDAVQAEVNKQLKGSPKATKSVTEVANEVIQGKWGNNPERRKKLEAAGYNYSKVQAEVNRLMR